MSSNLPHIGGSPQATENLSDLEVLTANLAYIGL